MPYTIEETKSYSHPVVAVFTAALGAVAGLEGEVVKQDPKAGTLEAKFSKTIHGKVLGDRTQVEVTILEKAPDTTDVSVIIYPLDPVGRKLMFGARKGVSRTVLEWFFAHVEHRLKNS
ncbi:MAG: hypothetical protein HN413_03450 [Chloroflexi bacterium]|jgi:hypothetical protein|nr:hypothetical protein [Chloroflexota bacterium]